MPFPTNAFLQFRPQKDLELVSESKGTYPRNVSY